MTDNNQPWIDGAKEPPKVGSVIRTRTKGHNSGPVMEWHAHHVHPEFMDYYVLEESARPYVPPVEALPELATDLDGDTPDLESTSFGVGISSKKRPLNPHFLMVYAPTKREAYLRWNCVMAAEKARMGQGGGK